MRSVSRRFGILRLAPALVLGAVAAATSSAPRAQEIDQKLDNIVVLSTTQAQGVVQTSRIRRIALSNAALDALEPGEELDPSNGEDFVALKDQLGNPFNATSNYLVSCQTTGTRGLYCLNVKKSGDAITSVAVLRWANPDRDPKPLDSAHPQVAVDCDTLGLEACSGFTVDLAGRIWVAGRVKAGLTNAGTYSVLRLVERNGLPCNIGTQAGQYCYQVIASKRPFIHDLSMVDGEAANGFQYLKGVLAIEDATAQSVVFYRQGFDPVVLNKQWGLATGERLQGASLLQYQTATDTRNFILATTSNARVLGYEVPWKGGSQVFDTLLRLDSTAATANGQCAAGARVTGTHRVRASLRTDNVFFTSGDCLSAYAPKVSSARNTPPVTFPAGQRIYLFKMSVAAPAQQEDDDPPLPYEPGAPALSTLVGVSVSPGIEIDFVRDGCTTAAGCVVIRKGNEAAAKLANVGLKRYDVAGWVVYEVTGMVDCRYYVTPRPAICNQPDMPSVLDLQGNPTDAYNPTQQYLNISPMLPPEIVDAFRENFFKERQLLLQPDYRGRRTAEGDYTFSALFGIAEDGLVYKDFFDGEFDIGDLTGSQLGCSSGAPIIDKTVPPPWDVVVNISELSPTVGGPNIIYSGAAPPQIPGEPIPGGGFGPPYDHAYVSTLLNVGCGTTRLVGGRGSAFVYGLELSPSKTGPDYWPDSRFALLMRSLARDFDAHLYTYACKAYPETGPAGPAPLSAATCYQLQKEWPVLYDKLLKCVDATDQPKNSAGENACGAFDTQFPSFRDLVMAAPVNTDVPLDTVPDPFNYVGELKVRMKVMLYVYEQQFVPSIKNGGFEDPN